MPSGTPARDLIAANGQGVAVQPLRFCLADADDRQEPRTPCGFRFRRHNCVGLTVMLSALRMSDDNRGGARTFQHFGADVARERACDFRVTVLSADGEAACGGLCRPRDQRRGQADQNVGGWRRGFHRGGNRLDLAELRRQPVHLPVSGDQRPHDASRILTGAGQAAANLMP
jgi:hypothetical protein